MGVCPHYSDVPLRVGLLSGGRHHAHELPARAVVLEPDETVDEGEQRVVLAQTHVEARLPARSVLTEDDRAAPDALSAERLDAEPLGVAVAPLAAGALTLLVRHSVTRSPKRCLAKRRERGLGRQSRS